MKTKTKTKGEVFVPQIEPKHRKQWEIKRDDPNTPKKVRDRLAHVLANQKK